MKNNPSLSAHKHLHDTDSIDNSLENIKLASCRNIEAEVSKEINNLAQHLENKDFAVGPSTIGSELELALVDKDTLEPALVNTELCDIMKSKNSSIAIQPELSKFCLEYNGPVIYCDKQPLNTLAYEMEDLLNNARFSAHQVNANVIPIGIIPTLSTKHLGFEAITPLWRYYVIDKLMRALRNNEEFALNISGKERLNFNWESTVVSGVNSSYQVHLRVNPAEYNDYYNAAQLAAAFVLSVSGNSPFLVGHKLWEETRIAVFEHTVNNFKFHPGAQQEQQRVAFGRGWIKDGAIGLLKETCELFYPILPAVTAQPNTTNKTNLGPLLPNVTQHNGSVWPWNRAIYDATCGGHFRIEMRYLPAGPTVTDMVMNAGFMLGLTKALSGDINNIITDLPFKYAQYNFYQAAQYGLKANCVWLDKNKVLTEMPILKLLDQMLDLSAFGLQQLGVSEREITTMQSCIRQRYKNMMTGSIWQRAVFDKLIEKQKLSTDAALKEMFKMYIDKQRTNQPVGSWGI